MSRPKTPLPYRPWKRMRHHEALLQRMLGREDDRLVPVEENVRALQRDGQGAAVGQTASARSSSAAPAVSSM